MRLERIDGGFVQYYDNKVIEKITFLDVCTVYFHNKPPKELSNVDFGIAYNTQYGIPISEDGSKLFVGSWEWTKGLQAYDIETDTVLWKLKQGRIRNVFVYSDYLIVAKAYTAVFKIAINNGEVLGQVKSRALEHLFPLNLQYVLADAPVKIFAIDTDNMTVYKKYGNKILNSSNCLGGVAIRGVALNDNVLSISGYDLDPSKDGYFENRVIDNAFC